MKLGLHAHYTSSSDASENPARSHLHACDAEQIRLDNTPQMHRRLAFMLLASARALRPLARTLRGGNTLRKASSATTMSDTQTAASSTSEGVRDRLGFAVAATPHHTGTSTTS